MTRLTNRQKTNKKRTNKSVDKVTGGVILGTKMNLIGSGFKSFK